MRVRAIARRTAQIGPDDYETIPIVIDVPDSMTMGQLRERMSHRMCYTTRPEIMAFTVTVDWTADEDGR